MDDIYTLWAGGSKYEMWVSTNMYHWLYSDGNRVYYLVEKHTLVVI